MNNKLKCKPLDHYYWFILLKPVPYIANTVWNKNCATCLHQTCIHVDSNANLVNVF